jgi:hypothetical protein
MRRNLVDMIVSGVQNTTGRLDECGKALFYEEVSSAIDNYQSATFCRTTARFVRLRAAQVEAIAAELREHAGMLDTLSYIDDGERLVTQAPTAPGVENANDSDVARGACDGVTS